MGQRQNIHANPFSTHKLLAHPDRLHQWKAEGWVAPISVGIDVTNICNHRCPQCNGADFADKTTIGLDSLERIFRQLSEAGVKAVSLGGGGDASCHPHAAEILRLIHGFGMKVGLFTNGFLMRPDMMEAMVDCCLWVRISLDADGPALYRQTHGMGGKAFERVKDNTRRLVNLRHERQSPLTIGTSYLIGSHTISGIYGAAETARDMGTDYIRFRPYFAWNGDLPFARADLPKVMQSLDRCKDLETDRFKVSYPDARTVWVGDEAASVNYTQCHVHHFTTQIAASGKMYLCCHTKDREKYMLGDLTKQSFAEIWNSQRRRDVYQDIDYRDCPYPCMMSGHNELLETIAKPGSHSDFL